MFEISINNIDIDEAIEKIDSFEHAVKTAWMKFGRLSYEQMLSLRCFYIKEYLIAVKDGNSFKAEFILPEAKAEAESIRQQLAELNINIEQIFCF